MTRGYVKTYVIDLSTSHTPLEGAHSPSWSNGLIIIIIIIIIIKPMACVAFQPVVVYTLTLSIVVA
jgi:hypothetical protein